MCTLAAIRRYLPGFTGTEIWIGIDPANVDGPYADEQVQLCCESWFTNEQS
jgi:hypothetical protein